MAAEQKTIMNWIQVRFCSTEVNVREESDVQLRIRLVFSRNFWKISLRLGGVASEGKRESMVSNN